MCQVNRDLNKKQRKYFGIFLILGFFALAGVYYVIFLGNTNSSDGEYFYIRSDDSYEQVLLNLSIHNLIENKANINSLFNELINETNLEKEIKNLIIYKKGLFNSNFVSENDLLQILNPIINSESIWKSHALYLMAEYFYSKGEKQKSKEFFNQILILINSNNDIKIESQKRINRDFSE